MEITIHRGTKQIGGCVTEYEHDGWHLFVDYGEELPGGPKSGDLKVEGLTHGNLSKSTLLITHYHGDHIGCITKLPKELKIYMGDVARDIQTALSNHLKSVNPLHEEMLERLKLMQTFKEGRAFPFGPFNIMPITADHSAIDAYAFKITADGHSAYHSGDFRMHGFRSSKFPEVMKRFIGKVDCVVCEATNISRPNATSKTESALQRDFLPPILTVCLPSIMLRLKQRFLSMWMDIRKRLWTSLLTATLYGPGLHCISTGNMRPQNWNTTNMTRTNSLYPKVLSGF